MEYTNDLHHVNNAVVNLMRPLRVFSVALENHFSTCFFLAVVLSALSACAPLPRQHDQQLDTRLAEPVRPSDLDVNETFGEFGLIDVTEYDDVAFGLQYTFLGNPPSVKPVDVYVYPIALPTLMSLADVLEFEQHRLDSEIDHFWEDAQSGSDFLLMTYAPQGHGASAAGLLSARSVARNGVDYRTYSFLGIQDDAFFKIRMSVNAEEEFSAQSFQGVVDGAYDAVRIAHRTPRSVRVVVTQSTVEYAAQGQPCILAAWLVYGVKMKEAVSAQYFLSTLEREKVAREAAIEIWEQQLAKETLAGCDSTYMSHLAAVRDAGFLREHIFHFYGSVYWPAAEDLRSSEYLAWADNNLRDYVPIEFPGVLVDWAE